MTCAARSGTKLALREDALLFGEIRKRQQDKGA